MRILFIASRFPYPPRYGDQVRGYHQIRLLSRGHKIILISPPPAAGERASAITAMEAFCEEIHLVQISSFRRCLNLLQIPFSSVPFQTMYFYDKAFKIKVEELVNVIHCDLLYVQLVRMGPAALNISKSIPTVLDFIDALSVNMAQRAKRQFSIQKLIAGAESQRLASYERSLMSCYTHAVISSPTDRAAIGNFQNLHVVPNGVDIDSHRFIATGRSGNMIVFTGAMSYFPNVDAVTWFVREVFPLIRSKVPDVQFYIVGSRPTRAVRRMVREPGVYVTGHVSSIQEYLARATIAIAPMRNGSGMQFKVIEAMANGVPFVATPFAMGGLEARNGEHLLIETDAKSFCNCILRLLGSGRLRQQLAINARKLVEQKYSWPITVNTLEGIFAKAVANKESVF
jgi:sugar transferase (PEP-CTERM/EpsH1 system associated)